MHKEAAQRLLAWYDQNARTLPWRSNPDPYWVWISEIMLQQTRVEAALSYYYRFIDRLKDIPSLAAVSDEELNALWQGLGYYNRARNLKKAAIWCVEHNGGKLPDTFEGLLALPGIGEYTAGAISSIAFGRREIAVDGNVIRVITRLFALPGDIVTARNEVSQNVRIMQDPLRPGDFNQALMELGAIVCLPNGAPLCHSCPWKELCKAREEGDPLKYPQRKEKPDRRIEERRVYLILSKGRVLLHKREAKGLLPSLWEFPNELTEEPTRIEEMLQYPVLEPVGKAKHIFSHIEWHMKGFLARVDEISPLPEGFAWADETELRETFALPSAFKVYRKAALKLMEAGEANA